MQDFGWSLFPKKKYKKKRKIEKTEIEKTEIEKLCLLWKSRIPQFPIRDVKKNALIIFLPLMR